MCHCPTSNLFIGSGFFNIDEAVNRSLVFGSGTDIGAGTTFSLLDALGEVYKVAMASDTEFANAASSDAGRPFNGDPHIGVEYYIPKKKSYHLSPLRQIYLATLGTARQLHLDRWIGNFRTGKEADFVVLDLEPSPLLSRRRQVIQARTRTPGPLPLPLKNLADSLFGLTTVPTDRSIYQTFVAGRLLYSRKLNYHQSLDADYTKIRILHEEATVS